VTTVRLRIEGHHLPGARCGPYSDVHVGVQVGREPEGLVRADEPAARWELDLEAVQTPSGLDWRGAAVQGRPRDRFVYLTWGTGAGADFAMFRRAKLMLADLPVGAAEVTARVDMTDENGMPRCARLRPPALALSPTMAG
jgi:hypothetical protein